MCRSSDSLNVTIPLVCSHGYIKAESASYLKGRVEDLCVKDSRGDLDESDKLCKISNIDYIVSYFNRRCKCQKDCQVTTFIDPNQEAACNNTQGPHNIHILYTCRNATYVDPPCSVESTTLRKTSTHSHTRPLVTTKATPQNTVTKSINTSRKTTSPTPPVNSNNTKVSRFVTASPGPRAVSREDTTDWLTTYSTLYLPEAVTSTPSSNSNTNKVSSVVIAGATLGALAILILVVLLSIWLCRRKKIKEKRSKSTPSIPTIVHVDHDSRGGGSGATVVESLKHVSDLPKVKYNSLQRKAFILNTLVPAQQAGPNRLPDVVMNNDDNIVLTPYAVSIRHKDIMDGICNFGTENKEVVINHDYARIKGANRDSILSNDSDISMNITSSSDVDSSTLSHISYARTMPRQKKLHDIETERYRAELPNSPEYATVGPASKEGNKVMDKVKQFEADSNASDSRSQVVPSTSNNTLNSYVSDHSSISESTKNPSVDKMPLHISTILNCEESLDNPEGTVMENNPLYVESRLSHTSI